MGLSLSEQLMLTNLTNLVSEYFFIAIILSFIGICVLALSYAFPRYVTMCVGRKAGNRDDWMPFVPIANTMYKLQMVDEPWWKVFFFGATGMSLSMLVGWVFFIIFHFVSIIAGVVIGMIILLAYQGFVLYNNVNFGFKYHAMFDLNPKITFWAGFQWLYELGTAICFFMLISTITLASGGLAFLSFLGFVILTASLGNPTIALVDLLIGFSNKYERVDKMSSGDRSKQSFGDSEGRIVGLSGMYAGQVLTIKDGEEFIFGRDSACAHIVIDNNAEKVSRKHCSIRYDARSQTYHVTDYSSNGTFTNNGTQRLVANHTMTLEAGSVISLGNNTIQFRLG